MERPYYSLIECRDDSLGNFPPFPQQRGSIS